jgi:hypothetical protein
MQSTDLARGGDRTRGRSIDGWLAVVRLDLDRAPRLLRLIMFLGVAQVTEDNPTWQSDKKTRLISPRATGHLAIRRVVIHRCS